MQLSDKFVIDNKTLSFSIFENGDCFFYKDIGYSINYHVLIKSLDTDLTTNILRVEMPEEHDYWKYSWPICISSIKNNHPGFIFEIYDMSNNLIFKKTYRLNSSTINIRLRSNPFDVTYPPFITFLYDDKFKLVFNIKENDVVYDLGANIGSFSLVCSNYDIKKIYAFEPNPKTFDDLVYNTDKYGKNVTCFRKAISDSFKNVSFGKYDGNSLEDGSCGCSIVGLDNQLEIVSAINLESFVHINKLELPTFLKVDIEGAEYDFLESTTDDFFKNCHTIFLEFHNRNERLNKIIDRFIKLNYKMSFFEDPDRVLNHNMGTIFFIKKS